MSAIARRVAALPLITLLASALFAQESVPSAAETIDVSIVNVDVFVTDRRGNRVRGLTADDFVIRENGRPQSITNFAEYAPSAATVADAVEVSPQRRTATSVAPEKRTIVIFIESATLAPFRAKPFFESIRQMVRRTVRPGDSVAIVSWMYAALVRQDFTDDVESIEAVLDEIEEESTGVEGNPAELLRRQTEFAQAFSEQLANEDGLAAYESELTTFHALSAAQWELRQIRQKSLALRSYMESIAGAEGKKILLMAMNRFGQYAGTEFFGGEVPFRLRDMLDTRPYREAVIATANAHNITIYPIFPRGIGSTPRGNAEDSGERIFRVVDSDADLRRLSAQDVAHLNESTSLYEIAQTTGGLSATGVKNVAELLPRVADDLESYYSIAYRAPETGKDAKRTIRVTAKNGSYVVRSRRQYVEKSDETRMNDMVIANLVQPTTGGTIPLEIETGDVTELMSGREVALSIRIPAAALASKDGGSFTVYIASGGAFGVTSDVHRKTQVVEKGTEPVDGYFTYDVTVRLDSGAYRISIGVFDERSKEFGLGRITVPVEEGE